MMTEGALGKRAGFPAHGGLKTKREIGREGFVMLLWRPRMEKMVVMRNSIDLTLINLMIKLTSMHPPTTKVSHQCFQVDGKKRVQKYCTV